MQLTIIGSGTCVPSLKRSPCSILVQAGGLNILVDLGPGIIRRLLQAGVHIQDIDVICLSHFHPDHCADLVPFIFATKYPGFNRDKKLSLVGGLGIRELYGQLNKAFNHYLEMPKDLFHIIELDKTGSSNTCIPGLNFAWTTVEHRPESRAFRFDNPAGFSIVYSGDTGKSRALADLARDADILVCESALPDEDKVPGHLTPSEAGELAAFARVKKLVLTHFYPECDDADIERQCRRRYQGPLVLARDLMEI